MIEMIPRDEEERLYFVFPIKNIILNVSTKNPTQIKKQILNQLNKTYSYKQINLNIKKDIVSLIINDLYLIEGKKLFKSLQK